MAAQVLLGLAARRHRVRAVAPITADELQGGDRFALENPGIEVARFVVPYLDNSPDVVRDGAYRQLEGDQVAELVSGFVASDRPDVIVVGRESFAWHLPSLAHHSVPLVLLIQGTTMMGILEGTYSPDHAQELLERFRLADCTVTVATHLARVLHERGAVGVEVVPNPVDLQRFRPEPRGGQLSEALGVAEEDVVAAHVSNLKALKRPLDIVDSAERALREDARLLYVVVGDGSLREAMEEACSKKRVSHRFRFVGWVPHEKVPDYLNLADLVVMPSAGEAQALVYLETQACARTLVASDIPAAREVIADGETGLLFRAGDVEHLVERTLTAASSPALRAEIGRRARRHVASHSLPRTVARYEAVLLRLARNGSRRESAPASDFAMSARRSVPR